MNFEREFSGPNLGYVLELYERYQRNPDSVNEASRGLFDEWKSANHEIGIPLGIDLQKLIGVVNLAQAIRTYGYLAADLDPLGSSPRNDPILNPEFHNLRQDDLFQMP